MRCFLFLFVFALFATDKGFCCIETSSRLETNAHSLSFKVIELNDTTFDQVVSSKDSILVNLYASWCGDSLKLLPQLDETAEKLKALFPDSVPHIANVDIDKSPKTKERFNIKHYPTLLLFEYGQDKEEILSCIAKGWPAGCCENNNCVGYLVEYMKSHIVDEKASLPSICAQSKSKSQCLERQGCTWCETDLNSSGCFNSEDAKLANLFACGKNIEQDSKHQREENPEDVALVAYCEILLHPIVTCDYVIDLITKRMSGEVAYNDPLDGKYHFEQGKKDFIYGTHTSADQYYVDDIWFNAFHHGSSCNITALSKRRTVSFYDFSANYCNLYNLYKDMGGLVKTSLIDCRYHEQEKCAPEDFP